MKFQQGVFSTNYQGAYPNVWDMLVLFVVFAIIIVFALIARQMGSPYHLGETIVIHLNPSYLPNYALHTVLRMFMAMGISLLLTFLFGTWAAKSKHAERIIIPLVDVLQSVPILGFLSITVPTFIGLFPHSLWGPECAAIFAIVTSQVWNMLLGFHQSLKSVPAELKEASRMFHLNIWQRYWRVEVPMTIPSLLWNSMLSMSAAWFFVVASEAISVNNQSIMLPGIGSYIAMAIASSNIPAILLAILTMFVVILLYDQLLFRPLLAWAEKFKSEINDDEAESWVVDVFRNTRWCQRLGHFLATWREIFINGHVFRRTKYRASPADHRSPPYISIGLLWLGNGLVYLAIAISAYLFFRFMMNNATWQDVAEVFGLGLITALKILLLIALSSLLWIPIGVWVGLRPKVAVFAQPIAQFLAAFPANLLYPMIVLAIVHFDLNVNFWTAPLIILGTQWYILFNVIAGTTMIPKELLMATRLFGVHGWVKWRSVILPAIFPYYITGAMTAAGGAWNASIVAEVVSWGNETLRATGLGAYISVATTSGEVAKEVLGIVVMCMFVIIINRLVWRPLYRLAEERFQVE